MRVAESICRSVEALDDIASMGPQHESCGKQHAERANNHIDIWLQWGRNMRVAESAVQQINDRAAYELQWGRNMRVAESARSYSTRFGRACFNGAAT